MATCRQAGVAHHIFLKSSHKLCKNSKHTISSAYVRRLGNTGKVNVKVLDGRTKLYSRQDIEAYVVRKRGEKEEEAEDAA